MTQESYKRKLTAILSADVKGYSRLMGEDEKGTVRTLNAYTEGERTGALNPNRADSHVWLAMILTASASRRMPLS
jgi:hypothetical protein